jgi:glycosyltransferase involved in cell wall biosynthesis
LGESLKVWLVTVGEPLPYKGSTVRLWRCGLLARELASRGHVVTWWTSDFDHVRKKFIPEANRDTTFFGDVDVRYLHGTGYRTNVSLARFVNHLQLGMAFRSQARGEPRPDLVVASFPTIELAYFAVRLARANGAVSVLDVRDLWPDIFLDAVPGPARGVARLLLQPWFWMARQSLRRADSILGVSEGYLDWALGHAGRKRRKADGVYPLAYEATTASQEDADRVRSLHGVDLTRPIAIFAGSFGRTYDLGTIVEAARLLRDAKSGGVQFVLCGMGEQGEAWRRAAKGLDSVIFTGLLSAGELTVLLKASRIGLAAYAPGAPQGVPNKVIEYLAAGLPVASSLTGETQQMLSEEGCGFSYRAGDPGELARKIHGAVGDRQGLENMADNARRVFADRYIASKVFGEMASHLEQLVKAESKA